VKTQSKEGAVETEVPIDESDEGILRRYTGPGSKELRRLWPAFLAAFQYYFPANPLTRTGRLLRLARRPDFSKSGADIKKLLDDAARARETNRAKWADLFEKPAPAWLAELRTLSFQQFQDELRAIEAFGEALQAERDGNTKKRRRSVSRARYLMRRCDQNRRHLTQLVYESMYKSMTDD
jgi:hypothetical protein